MGTIGTSMTGAFDHAFGRLRNRLEGLSDDEYFWEPVPGCWSLRQHDDRWLLDGGLPPDPEPVTTIAWRVGHVGGLALGGFADWLFAEGSLTPEAIDFPGRAADVGAFLDANYGAWRAGLVGLSDSAWGDLLGPRWHAYADSSTLDLALHVFDELVHHGAEIALLRDLYSRRPPGTR